MSTFGDFMIDQAVQQEQKIDALKNTVELAKGITELTRVTDQAISLLAKAILELEKRPGGLRIETIHALRTLAEPSK